MTATTTPEEALFQVRRALHLLHKQLEEQPDPLLAFVPREQLLLFQGNLEQMEKVLQRGGSPDAPVGYGMAERIIQRWPFTSLGEAIVKAERAYQQVQQQHRA